MATVTARDTVEGCSLTNNSDSGLILVRRFIVEGVTGDASLRLLNAMTADGVPQKGTFHESISDMICDNVSVQPLSSGQFEVVCTYKVLNTSVVPDEGQPAQITVGSTVQSATTNIDLAGDDLALTFTIQDSNNDTGLVSDREETYHGKFDIDVPQTIASLTRREKQDPLRKSKDFVGTINRGVFLGDDPHIWLCTRIEGTTQDGGKTYSVTYEFQRNADTWDPLLVAYDPKTNAPPLAKYVVAGDISKRFRIYPETDFGILGLERAA